MGKTNKIILWGISSIVILLLCLTFIISKRIDLNEIKSISLQNLSNLFPGSNVKIGKIDHSFGTSIRIYLNDIVVKNNKSKDILKVKKFIIKFPITTLLIDKGNIDLKAENLFLNLTTLKSPRENKIETKGNSSILKNQIKLPSFVKSNKVNLKIIDSIIAKNKTQLEFNKILIKNINFKSSVAFEVTSKFSTSLAGFGKVHSDLQLVGEINLKNYFKKNELEGKILLTSKNLFFEQMNKKIPEFKQKIEFKYNNSGLHFIKTELFSEVVSLNAEGRLLKNELSLDKFDLEFDSSILRKDDLINFNDSKILFNGSLKINLKYFKLFPKIVIKTTKPFLLKIENWDSIPLTLNGDILDNKFSLSSSSTIGLGVMKQNIDFKLNNYLKKEINDFKYSLEMDKMILSQKQYDSFKKIRVKLPNTIRNKTIQVDLKNTQINNHAINLQANIKSVSNTIEKLSFALKSKTESLKVDLNKKKYVVQMKKLNSNLLKDLFIPTFPIINSSINGKVSFKLDNNKLVYSKGYIKGLNGEFSSKSAITILKTNKIKNYKLILKMKKKRLVISQFRVNGPRNIFSIKSSGDLNQNKINLTGNVFIHTSKIPFKVSGPLEAPKLEI
jgi:hypothetical protein